MLVLSKSCDGGWLRNRANGFKYPMADYFHEVLILVSPPNAIINSTIRKATITRKIKPLKIILVNIYIYMCEYNCLYGMSNTVQ